MFIQDEHRHDEPGRTEPALAPVMLHHRFLDGMERPVRGPEVLDCDDLLSVDHGEEHQAGVDRPVTESAVRRRPGYRDSACAAIPFGTTLLHTFVRRKRTEIIQNGC